MKEAYVALNTRKFNFKWILLIGIGYTKEYFPMPKDRVMEKVSWYFPFCKLVAVQLFIKPLTLEKENEDIEGNA